MKLRNKQTGGIIDLEQWRLEYYKDSGCITLTNEKNQNEQYCYRTFADMKDDWADYIPPEPLIKDAGVREVMRLWAKVNLIPTNATTIEYHFADSLCGKESEFWDNNLHIMFYGKIAPNAVHGGIYTIAELCGEDDNEA